MTSSVCKSTCDNCGYVLDVSKVDTDNTKQVFQGTETSTDSNTLLDVYSTYGICRRCNQYGILLKIEKKAPKLSPNVKKASIIQNRIRQLFNK